MKSLLAMLALVLNSVALAESLRLSEPIEVTTTYEVFGAPMPDKTPGIGLKALVAREDAADGSVVRVTTRVAQVCQKKGCFFIATEGETWARVTFADYAFFVPTDSSGKNVTLQGTFERREISAEQAAHYAADMGLKNPKISGPQFEYTIVATSVLLPR